MGIKYQEKSNVASEISVIAGTSNNISNDINIYKKDIERFSNSICGYSDINQKILNSQGVTPDKSYRLGEGVWSNDCARYIYSFRPLKGWGTEAPYKSDGLDGLWLYQPEKSTSTRISESLGVPVRWLTYNLVSLDNKSIIDVELKKIVSDENVDESISPWSPSKYSDWIMYRNADFGWQFMHPKTWKLIESVKNSSGKIDKLVFNTSVLGLNVEFYSEIPASIKLDRYQANFGGNLSKFGYKYYYSQSLNPSRVYVNNKNSNFPSAIVFSWIKDQDLLQRQDNELVYLGETIKRYEF